MFRIANIRNRHISLIGVILLAIFGGLGCAGARKEDIALRELLDKQLRFAKFYQGAPIVTSGLLKFNEKNGRWPKDYKELFAAGHLPLKYEYATRDGKGTQFVSEDFAAFKVVEASPARIKYRLRILGHEMEESTLTADP